MSPRHWLHSERRPWRAAWLVGEVELADARDFGFGGDALGDLVLAVLAQGAHAVTTGDGTDLVDGGAQFVADEQHLEDAHPTAIAGAEAVPAATGLPFGSAGIRDAALASAVGTDAADEPLGDDAKQSGGDEEALDAHLQETADSASRIVGVQGAEHKMPGQGGVNGDLGGLQIADLSDCDAIRAEIVKRILALK